ncbi:MAG: hypothetical protein KDK70_41465, partial [Myxococcales bacterium]|nr:hypothetical protein [Myxococcales bacterium]
MIGLSRALGLPLHVWSQCRGVWGISADGEAAPEDDQETDALAVLQRIHAAEEPGLWLLEDFHPFLRTEHHPVLRWLRELARLPTSPRKVVVLSTPATGLPHDLCKEVPTLELPLPGVADLREVFEQVASATGV